MLGQQTGRQAGPREVFAQAFRDIDPTPDEIKLVNDRLAFVMQTFFPILEEKQISPSEAMSAILSFVVRNMGETKMEDAEDAVMFETLSIASAGALVAITDLIVTKHREDSHARPEGS